VVMSAASAGAGSARRAPGVLRRDGRVSTMRTAPTPQSLSPQEEVTVLSKIGGRWRAGRRRDQPEGRPSGALGDQLCPKNHREAG